MDKYTTDLTARYMTDIDDIDFDDRYEIGWSPLSDDMLGFSCIDALMEDDDLLSDMGDMPYKMAECSRCSGHRVI